MYLHSGLFHELDIDEVGLCSIRLPKCIRVFVPELLNPVASFGRAEGPYSLVAYLSFLGVGSGSSVRLDVRPVHLNLEYYSIVVVKWDRYSVSSID